MARHQQDAVTGGKVHSWPRRQWFKAQRAYRRWQDRPQDDTDWDAVWLSLVVLVDALVLVIRWR